MTRRPGRSTSNDPGSPRCLTPRPKAICFVAKSWDYHVRVALETTLDENLASIRDSVRAAKEKGREVLLDCEHFFDGYKANPSYALACARTAYEEGARWVVLCDTNGGTLPNEVEAIVAEVVRHIPGGHVGIHAHNDTEQAVANSFAAVRAGARQIQGTLNGLGERCGNANLVSIIPTLKLKPEYAERFEIGVSDEQLTKLAHVSHALDERLNRAPNRHAPYVGESAFATKAGIHASAIMKDPATYEHVAPETIGNRRKLLVSDQAGRSNVLAELDRIGLKVDKNDPRVTRLLDEVKEREAIGYAYETADASFELLARRMLGTVPKFFDVTYFDVKVEQRGHNGHGNETLTTAVVKVKIGNETLISAAEGNGPVNALDVALRKDLGKYQKLHRGTEADRLSRAYPQFRHRGGHARADRERGRDRRALDDGRRVAQHHRCLVPGADGFDRLQARPVRRAGVGRAMPSITRRAWMLGAAALPPRSRTRAGAAPPEHREFIEAAFRMRDEAVRAGDQAYGAVVVKDGRIIGFGPSRVVLKNDSDRACRARSDPRGPGAARQQRPGRLHPVFQLAPCSSCETAAADANVARMIYGRDATDAGRPRRS